MSSGSHSHHQQQEKGRPQRSRTNMAWLDRNRIVHQRSELIWHRRFGPCWVPGPRWSRPSSSEERWEDVWGSRARETQRRAGWAEAAPAGTSRNITEDDNGQARNSGWCSRKHYCLHGDVWWQNVGPAENCFKQVRLQMGQAVHWRYHPENEALTSHLP